ncbi:MAG: hypothetical protein M3P18_20980 [Actinomycetota bacterium]|nr:hypothetical protein [Actinomycetota bacterium]
MVGAVLFDVDDLVALATPSSAAPDPLACVPGDTSSDYGASGLWFQDVTQGWTAGQSGDCIGLIVSSYTDTQIVYTFGADYPNFSPVTDGDHYTSRCVGSRTAERWRSGKQRSGALAGDHLAQRGAVGTVGDPLSGSARCAMSTTSVRP